MHLKYYYHTDTFTEVMDYDRVEENQSQMLVLAQTFNISNDQYNRFLYIHFLKNKPKLQFSLIRKKELSQYQYNGAPKIIWLHFIAYWQLNSYYISGVVLAARSEPIH